MGVIRELLEAQALEEWRLRSKQAERQRQQLAGKPSAEVRGAFKDAYRAARENTHFTGSPFKTAGDFAWEPDVPVPKTKMLKLAARLLRADDPLQTKERVRKSKYNATARERRATLARAGIQDEQSFGDLEAQEISEALVRQRPASAGSSLKDSLHFLASGDNQHPDYEKHFKVYKQAIDRILPGYKRYAERRGADPNELESQVTNPDRVRAAAAAALNHSDHEVGFRSALHRNAKWGLNHVLTSHGSAPEGTASRRFFSTKPIVQGSDREPADPRKFVQSGSLGRGPQRGSGAPDRAHHSVPAANQVERFSDDPKVHQLTSKVMDMVGHQGKHHGVLHAFLNHIVSTRDPASDEAGATGFQRKAESLGVKLPKLANWRSVASRFLKKLRDHPEVGPFLRSSIGVHAESILGATMTQLTESIAAFREAQQLDEAFEKLKGAWAGWKAGGFGGARQGWQMGKEAQQAQAARDAQAKKLKVGRAVGQALGTMGTSGSQRKAARTGVRRGAERRLGRVAPGPYGAKADRAAVARGDVKAPGERAAATLKSPEPTTFFQKHIYGPPGKATVGRPDLERKPASPAPAPATAAASSVAPTAAGAAPAGSTGAAFMAARAGKSNPNRATGTIAPAPAVPSTPEDEEKKKRAAADAAHYAGFEDRDYKNALIEGLLAFKLKTKLIQNRTAR